MIKNKNKSITYNKMSNRVNKTIKKNKKTKIKKEVDFLSFITFYFDIIDLNN